MPSGRHVEENSSSVILATKETTGVAPKVNLAGEPLTRTPLPSANKAAHSRFEPQRRRHEKSKIGVSVAPQKVLCPPIFF